MKRNRKGWRGGEGREGLARNFRETNMGKEISFCEILAFN